MTDNYIGAIIEESLEDKNILKKIKITETKIIPYNERLKTSWVKQWTFHYIEVDENDAEKIADEISKSMDSKHGAWYADFKNSKIHFVIFHDRVFRIDRTNKEQYDKAIEYGSFLGIPDYQLDFSPFD